MHLLTENSSQAHGGETAGAQACKQDMAILEPTLITSKLEASEGRAAATSS